MDYLKRAHSVFEIEIRELERLKSRLGGPFRDAVELIRARIQKGGTIIVLGVGKSGHIGDKVAATLTSTGSPAIVLNSLNALHGDLGIVSDGDVLLALSYSGETDELLNILPALKCFDLPIIAMTGKLQSTLAVNADIVLDIHIEQEACPLNLAPTSSTTSMLVLGDALAMALLEAHGLTREDFARYHPGGSLGRALLTKVSDVMRGKDRLPVLAPDTSVRTALRAMTSCRAGAAAVASKEDGRLLGVFTHGDFVRHYQSDPMVGDRPVEAVMTHNPITISSERLAGEAVRVFSQSRIDDLIVVNDRNQPVGLIDTADLTRLKLL